MPFFQDKGLGAELQYGRILGLGFRLRIPKIHLQQLGHLKNPQCSGHLDAPNHLNATKWELERNLVLLELLNCIVTQNGGHVEASP